MIWAYTDKTSWTIIYADSESSAYWIEKLQFNFKHKSTARMSGNGAMGPEGALFERDLKILAMKGEEILHFENKTRHTQCRLVPLLLCRAELVINDRITCANRPAFLAEISAAITPKLPLLNTRQRSRTAPEHSPKITHPSTPNWNK